MKKPRYIIYGVLNWGLGHATRSEPVLRALQERGFIPVIASDGLALHYLRNAFPELPWHELPGYKVHYGTGSFLPTIMRQVPVIYRAVRQEHRALRVLAGQYRPLGIISDNRLGFYLPGVASAYLTHQLNIRLPFPGSMANPVHYGYIRKFRECWVPDLENEADSLAGRWAHREQSALTIRYIGPLSRFEAPAQADQIYDAIAVLSGPEPQRTLLEQKLVRQLENRPGNYLLVRGTHEAPALSTALPTLSLADAPKIREAIAQAQLVISRSGYSSLMDYYYLGNKALLIATPGQVEQEFLAQRMTAKGWFHHVSQEAMDLAIDLPKALAFSGFREKTQATPDWDQLFRLFEGE